MHLNNNCVLLKFETGVVPDGGGRGAVAPLSGNVSPPASGTNFVSVREFSTENCVLMHRKIPFIFLAPLSGNPAPPPTGKILAPPLV